MGSIMIYTILTTISSGENLEQIDIIGDPYKASGWYNFNECVHTISISLSNFVGRIYIEGSISNDPTTNDWFSLNINGTEYLEYPIGGIPLNQSGSNVYGGLTGTFGYTFQSNIIWIRARIVRSYWLTGPLTNEDWMNIGSVKYIKLSM